jgi:hypothetical protein
MSGQPLTELSLCREPCRSIFPKVAESSLRLAFELGVSLSVNLRLLSRRDVALIFLLRGASLCISGVGSIVNRIFALCRQTKVTGQEPLALLGGQLRHGNLTSQASKQLR